MSVSYELGFKRVHCSLITKTKLYLGCQSGFLQIYELETCEMLREIRTRTDVRAICLLPDNSVFCAQSFGMLDIVSLEETSSSIQTKLPVGGTVFCAIMLENGLIAVGCTQGLIFCEKSTVKQHILKEQSVYRAENLPQNRILCCLYNQAKLYIVQDCEAIIELRTPVHPAFTTESLMDRIQQVCGFRYLFLLSNRNAILLVCSHPRRKFCEVIVRGSNLSYLDNRLSSEDGKTMLIIYYQQGGKLLSTALQEQFLLALEFSPYS